MKRSKLYILSNRIRMKEHGGEAEEEQMRTCHELVRKFVKIGDR